jgi:hypothetical protein
MRELVLIHGRSQENQDSIALKREWLDSLNEGLHKSGLTLPIPEAAVRFPYYGQALYDLISDVAPDDVADIPIRSLQGGVDADVVTALTEIAHVRGISDDQIFAEARAATVPELSRPDEQRGPQNWRLIRGIVAAIDLYVPGASGAGVALTTADVFQYLNIPSIKDPIEAGVRKAMAPNVESVVVGHSLGSVVAYNLLRWDGPALGWRVPVFITVGSPLGVTAIRKALKPARRLPCVGAWYNARDKDDIVALYPLDDQHFPLRPPIENSSHVVNGTPNQHGIRGYLSDAEVARRIHEALTVSV